MDFILKRLYADSVKQGNFVQALKIVRKNAPLPLTDKIGCNTIVLCCHGLLKVGGGEDTTAQIESAVELINLIDFDDLEREYLITVLDSLYFILRSFIKCKNLDAILRIEKHIFPPLTGPSLNDNEKKMLKSISEILHNAMVRNPGYEKIRNLMFLVTKTTVQSSNSFVQLMNFLVQHYQTSTDHTDFFQILDAIPDIDKETVLRSFLIVRVLSEKSIGTEKVAIVMEKFAEFLQRTEAARLVGTLENLTFLFGPVEKYPKNFPLQLTESMGTLRRLHAITEMKAYVERFCYVSVNLLCFLKNQYKNVAEDIWRGLMDGRALLVYCDFAELLAEILAAAKDSCDCCKLGYNASIVMHSYILPVSLPFQSLCFGDSDGLSEDYLNRLLTLLKQACRHVEVLKSKQCKRLQYAWNNVGTNFYNICIKLHKAKIPCFEYFSVLIKWCFRIEGANCKPFNEAALDYLVSIYMEMHFKKGDYNAALKLAALYVILFGENCMIGLSYWLKSKNLLGEENETIVNVYNNNINYYKSISPHFKRIIDCDLKKKILTIELNAYLEKWPKKACILVGLKALYEVSDALDVAEIIIRLKLTDVMVMEMKQLMQKCVDDLNEDAVLIKGCLQYLIYRKETYEIFDKFCKNLKVSGDDEEIQEQCELSFYSKQYRYLRDAFPNIERGISKLNRANENILPILIDMAYIHQLNCDEIKSLETWRLVYKVAKINDDAQTAATASGFILSGLKVTDEAFQTFKNCDNCDDLTTLLFYINLCFAYLRNGLNDELKTTFELATECYYRVESKQGDLNVDIVRIYYMLLESHLTNIPCEHNVYKHDELIIKPYLAYKVSKIHITRDTIFKTPFLAVVYFELIKFLLDSYYWMRMPRELKVYGEDALYLAHNSLLTFQTARISIYLAKGDVLTCSMDECRIKLDKISQLLSLKCPTDELSAGLQNIYLTAQPYAATSGSPILFTESLQLPRSMHHESDCDCIPCGNPYFDKLFLEILQTEALLSECLKNNSATANFHKAISDYTKFALNKQPGDLQPTIDSIKLDLIKHNLRNKNYTAARELNEELLLRLNKDPCKNYFLYNEILNLQLNLLMNFEGVKNLDTIKTPDEKIVFKSPQRTVPFKIYTPAPNKPKIKLEVNTCGKVPLNYDRPVSPKIEKKLNKLTKELMSEQKKSEHEMDERKVRVRRAVRKNLLMEMEEEEKPAMVTRSKRINASKAKTKTDKVPDVVVTECSTPRTRRSVAAAKKNEASVRRRQ